MTAINKKPKYYFGNYLQKPNIILATIYKSNIILATIYKKPKYYFGNILVIFRMLPHESLQQYCINIEFNNVIWRSFKFITT